MIIVVISLIFAIIISLKEWDKFRNNPTALFIETDYHRIFFDEPGLTICPIHIDETLVKNFVAQKLMVVENDPEFEYYQKYINIIATTNYTNLAMYKPFKNDTRINAKDFAKIATELKYRSENLLKTHLRLVLTELGVCFTSSRIDVGLNPYKG